MKLRSDLSIKIVALITAIAFSCQDEEIRSDVKKDDCVVRTSSANRLIEGEYIISPKNSAFEGIASANLKKSEILDGLLNKYRISSKSIISSSNTLTHGLVVKLSSAQAAQLENESDILIEQNRIVSISSCFTVVDPRRISWGVKRVGYGDGTGKTAWIIDTGIDFDHEDLNVDKIRSKSFIPDKSAKDDNGHGTHIAGIIGAKNNRIGFLGVASNATLISLKALDEDGEGRLSYVIQAVNHVYKNGKAGDVVNMSLGEGESAILDQEVKRAAQKGILFAVAAGNDAKDAITESPARISHANVYTVSAMDSTDTFANFSNFGTQVDFCAPGVRITSTFLNNRYAIMSGTSMAAPHVAGLLLLRGNAISSSGYVKKDPDGTADPIAHF